MDRTDNARRTFLICAALAAVTLAAFWPVFRNDFVSYDDRDYVTENAHVLTGLTWANVQWAFRTGWAGNWHPLTWLSHMADVQLYGLKPHWHHLTSLVFHAANAVLLFLLLKRLTGACWRSACVAALFALHPLHVESVAWVAERKDVLSAFFFMLTLWAYAGYTRRSVISNQCSVISNQRSVISNQTSGALAGGDHRSLITDHRLLLYLLSLSFFTLGLMCKPMLVTVPAVLLLLDFWPLRRLDSATFWRLVLEKIPFLALSAASSVVTFLIQQDAGAVSSLEALSLEFRLSNALISYVRYAAKMIWPANLAAIYPVSAGWPPVWVAAAALALAGVSALALYRARKAPYLVVGWLWYLGMLVPVIGIVQVGRQAMADRYTYLPLIGLFLAVVWALAEIPARWPGTRTGLAACGAAVLAACATLTWNQTARWATSTSLFEHALAVTRNNPTAQNNLGVELLDAGNLPAAEEHFAEAVRLQANYADALGNLGLCRARQGRLEESGEWFQRSLKAKPTSFVEYNFARFLAQQGQVEEAEAHYQAALRLKPEFVQAWYNLGALELQRGKAEEAAQDFGSALRIKPDYAEAHLSLGALLAGQKKFDEAIVHFRAALLTTPDNADAHFNLGAALNAKGDFAGAAAQFEEACRLHPQDVEAHWNLGLALLYQGNMAEAAPQFREVLRLRPDARAHYYLALALDGDGQAKEALAHYREAARLSPNTPLYLNDLAWLLATNPQAELRDGAEAVRLAEQACRLSGGKEARFWGTLDAAYAESGRLDDAVATVAKTRELALAAGQPEIARRAEERLALYRAGKPYRTATPPQTSR